MRSATDGSPEDRPCHASAGVDADLRECLLLEDRQLAGCEIARQRVSAYLVEAQGSRWEFDVALPPATPPADTSDVDESTALTTRVRDAAEHGGEVWTGAQEFLTTFEAHRSWRITRARRSATDNGDH